MTDNFDDMMEYVEGYKPKDGDVFDFIEYKVTKGKIIFVRRKGQEVTRLVSEVQQAGYHQVTWNASNLPSGIYFYRLQAGEFVQTRKMLLIK